MLYCNVLIWYVLKGALYKKYVNDFPETLFYMISTLDLSASNCLMIISGLHHLPPLNLLSPFKCDTSVLPRIGALREVQISFNISSCKICLFFGVLLGFFDLSSNILFGNIQMNLEYFPIDGQVRQQNLFLHFCFYTFLSIIAEL